MEPYAAAGNSIADGLTNALQYLNKANKEKDSYEQALSRLEVLKSWGTKGGQTVQIDPNVKDKDIIPLINPKAYEDIKNNKTHSRAQKMGEIKAVSEMAAINLRSQLQQAARQQAQPMTTEAVVPGGPLRTFPQSQAAQQDLQKANAEARGKLTQKKEERADTQLDISKQHLDIAKSGLKLRGEAGRQQWIQNQPETKFFNETGVSPRIFVDHVKTGDSTLGQQGYEVYAPEGMKVAEFPPLKAGESLQDVRRRPSSWEQFFHLGMAGPTRVQPKFVAKGDIYREKEYQYGAQASKDKPASVRFAPHPEGEYLRIGEKRVKYNDAAGLTGMVERRRKDAQDALKTLPLPTIKQRLDDLGYDSNDPYWGLPQPPP